MTTPEVLDAVLKVFAGTVNAELVSALRAAGAKPVGLTGLDAGLVDAEPFDPALGHVGKPVHSDPRLLDVLIGEGFLPVVACVAGDAKGGYITSTATKWRVACAARSARDKLIFLTDVDGVRGWRRATRGRSDRRRARGSDSRRNRQWRDAGQTRSGGGVHCKQAWGKS